MQQTADDCTIAGEVTGQTTLISSLLKFLQKPSRSREEDSAGCLEKVQPPISGVVLSFDPLVITDWSFQYSLEMSGFDGSSYKNSDLDSASFGIELIDWKWRLSLNRATDDTDPLELIQAFCSSFKVWRDTGNIIEVDTIPPPVVENPRVSLLVEEKTKFWKEAEQRARIERQNKESRDFIDERNAKRKNTNECSTEIDDSSLSSHQKENNPVGRSNLLNNEKDQKMYLFKKSIVLRGHPVLIKIKERSRSSSPNRAKFKETSEIISVISDNEE